MNPVRVGYLLLFGTATLACLVAALRASKVDDTDTKTGLLALLLFSAVWAATSTARLLEVSPSIQRTLYMVGLVAGLATVGGWLYFCSAYTGHDYHRRPTVRVVALAVFVSITSVKLTNPVHGLYFTGAVATDPFPHVAIDLNATHWVVTAFAYAATAVGFYLLYERFAESQLDTTPLAALVGAAGLPAILDVAAYGELLPGLLLKYNYEPLGVAVFALGSLYVVDDRFTALPRFWRRRVLEQLTEAVVVADHHGHVRDFNAAAVEMFPTLGGRRGATLDDAAPPLADLAAADRDLVELKRDGQRRYYRVRETTLSFEGDPDRGTAFICTDVTDIERQRRDLRHQTEQFDDFADAVDHELRNAVTVIDGYLDVAAEAVDDDTRDEAVALDRVGEATDRMLSVIGDLTTLARYGQPVENPGECRLGAVLDDVLADGDYDGLDVELNDDGLVTADRRRLAELVRNVLTFADANDASRVTIAVGDGTITVTDDGTHLSPGDVEKAVEYGEPVPSVETGMVLPNVRTIARAHGWSLSVEPSYRTGVRLAIDGVEVAPDPDPDPDGSDDGAPTDRASDDDHRFAQ